jgi:hypothetical protein
MNKNMPAGNYTFNVGGDGYRLSIDGGAVAFLSTIGLFMRTKFNTVQSLEW